MSENNNNLNFSKLSYSEIRCLSYRDKKAYFEQLKRFLVEQIDFEAIEKEENDYLSFVNKVKPGFDTVFGYNVIDPENIPVNQGPCIFVANHLSNLDPPTIMSIINDRPAHLLLKYDMWGEHFGKQLSNIGVILVKREIAESRAMSQDEMIKRILYGFDCYHKNRNLNAGNLIIFPEGSRNKDKNDILPKKPRGFGAVRIAQITGAPIVPIGITRSDVGVDFRVGHHFYVSASDDLSDSNEFLHQRLVNLVNQNMEIFSTLPAIHQKRISLK